jgi:hypothetical protein
MKMNRNRSRTNYESLEERAYRRVGNVWNRILLNGNLKRARSANRKNK